MTILQSEFDLLLGRDIKIFVAIDDRGQIIVKVQVFERADLVL